MIRLAQNLHNSVFGTLYRSTESWLPGLLARFVFAAVLFMYFFHSAKTKLGELPLGIFQVQDGAYFQILPTVVERFGYDATQVPLFPYKLIVFAGTYSEFILPIILILGLFTRITACGMLVFIAVQTYVDIAIHNVGAETTGRWFDRLSDAAIMDQRAFWFFLLVSWPSMVGGSCHSIICSLESDLYYVPIKPI
ncbi:MAG: DoxX family membrane protein [Granulosicoccus sp.]